MKLLGDSVNKYFNLISYSQCKRTIVRAIEIKFDNYKLNIANSFVKGGIEFTNFAIVKLTEKIKNIDTNFTTKFDWLLN
jgi:hypothetical protein